jgi:hypothetical protein
MFAAEYLYAKWVVVSDFTITGNVPSEELAITPLYVRIAIIKK